MGQSFDVSIIAHATTESDTEFDIDQLTDAIGEAFGDAEVTFEVEVDEDEADYVDVNFEVRIDVVNAAPTTEGA